MDVVIFIISWVLDRESFLYNCCTNKMSFMFIDTDKAQKWSFYVWVNRFNAKYFIWSINTKLRIEIGNNINYVDFTKLYFNHFNLKNRFWLLLLINRSLKAFFHLNLNKSFLFVDLKIQFDSWKETNLRCTIFF